MLSHSTLAPLSPALIPSRFLPWRDIFPLRFDDIPIYPQLPTSTLYRKVPLSYESSSLFSFSSSTFLFPPPTYFLFHITFSHFIFFYPLLHLLFIVFSFHFIFPIHSLLAGFLIQTSQRFREFRYQKTNKYKVQGKIETLKNCPRVWPNWINLK